MKSLLMAATRGACKRAWSVLLLALILSCASLWVFVTRLSVITDTDAMIDPQLPYRQAYAAFQEAYPQLGDTLAVVIEGGAPEIRQRAADDLTARLEADAAHIQSVYAPSSLPFFKDNGLLFLSYDDLEERLGALIEAQPLLGPLLREPSLPLLLDSLAEAVEEGDAELTEQAIGDLATVTQAVLDGRPAVLSLQGLIGDPGQAGYTILVVQPVLDPSRVQPAKPALAALSEHIEAVQAALPIPVTISLTGKIALNAEELKSVTAGASLAGLLSLLLVTGVLYVGTRSVRAVIAMVLNLVVGLIATGAGALLIFGSLNIISVAFAVLFIGLGIDFAIHLLLRAREEAAERPLPEALEYAAGTSGLALALCAPTTALAFLSFTPTDYAGLAQLGVIAALGVFIALITSLTLLPALLVALRVPPRTIGAAQQGRSLLPPRAVLLLTALALLPAIYVASQISFSADPIRLKDPQSPSVLAYERLLEEDDFSPHVLNVMRPDMAAAQQAVIKAADLEAVGRTVWAGSFVPKEQDDKLALIEESYFLLSADLTGESSLAPVDPAATSASMERLTQATSNPVFQRFIAATDEAPELWELLSAAALATVPDLKDVLRRQLSTQGVEEGDVPEALTSRYRGADGSYRVEIFPASPLRDEVALAAFVADVQAVFPEATGSPVQVIQSGRIVERAMGQATLTAFGLVSVFLLIMLRSFAQVVFVLIPVALAAIATLASAVLLGLAFNFANVIVLPLLLGLGVDAGIHYVRRAFEGGAETVMETGSTGRAVLLSALTTIGSFGTLMVSSHAGTASMGQLLTLALFWLMVTTLVVLPALLSLRARA